MNDYGVVSVLLLRNWCERYSSLQRLVWNLTDLFGIDPHVRSEPKVSSHLRYFQEEEDTHESDNANAHVHVQRVEESTSTYALDEIYAMFSNLH